MLAIASLFVCGLAAVPAVATLPSSAVRIDAAEPLELDARAAGVEAASADKSPKAKAAAGGAATRPKDGQSDGTGDGKDTASPGAAADPQPLFIRAEKLYVRPGRVLENVGISVERGVITGVGAQLTAPKGARELSSRVVCAGFIDSWSSFALDPTSFGDERITAASTALDAVDPYVDPKLERAVLRSGVTSYRLQPSPSSRIAGLGAIMRLHPDRLLIESTVLGDCAFALTLGAGRAGNDVFERAADTERVLGAISDGWAYLEDKNEYRHDLAEWEKKIAEKEKELEEGFKKAKKDREKAENEAKEKGGEFKEKDYKEDKKPKPPRFDEDKEVLARAANGEMPVVVEAHNAGQIRALLDMTQRFKRARLVLAGATDARSFAEELAERRIPVIVHPRPFGADRPSTHANASLALAAELDEEGVEVIIGSGGEAGLASRDLSLLAALAIGHGLSRESALAAITTRPARVFDVASKVGSVEVGRHADLVLLDGEPFAATTRVRFVVSGGDVVVEE